MVTSSKITSLLVAVVLFALVRKSKAQVPPPNPAGTLSNTYLLDQARALLESGTMNIPEVTREQQELFQALYPNENPQTAKTMRETISKVTELINSYRQSGLTNMPNLPSLPGLNTVMRIPDKILRAELSMLQDEIRMAQDMMQNPISATLNAPKDLAIMIQRMARQLEQ